LDGGIGSHPVNTVLEIVRPAACLGATAVSALGSHLSGVPGVNGDNFAAALTVLFIVAACNTVNDIMDLSADRVNRPDRPLPSGRISVRQARTVAVVAASAGLASATALGPNAVLVAGGFLLAGILYSVFLKRVALIGHVWTAAVFGATAVWGAWTSTATPSVVWMAALLVTLFLLPRELLKSMGDVPGDILAGTGTAAVRWGRPATLRAVAVSEGLFAGTTVVPLLVGIGGVAYLAGIWAGAVLPLIAVTIWLWPRVDARVRRAEALTQLMWVSGLAALWQLG
jgi:4-hydroxybenzoate polyprenyltransferase